LRAPTFAIPCLLANMSMTWEETSASATNETIVAAGIPHDISINAAQPAPEWEQATEISFCADWQGQRRETARETEVRILWTPRSIYLRFVCRYKTLFVFDNADANGRRDHLWDRDVAEVFFQPNPSRSRHYREFEISPNGMWIDLDIFPGGMRNLKSGLQRSVWLDEARQRWIAELAIPIRAITSNFKPSVAWRANFYRIEGNHEPRFYSAWQPTRTAEPNFHVPEAFGKLLFQEL
jgi:alpha-galactosidase